MNFIVTRNVSVTLLMYPNHPCYTIDMTKLSWLHQACNVNIYLSIPANLHQTYLGEMYCWCRVKKHNFLLFQDNATNEYAHKFWCCGNVLITSFVSGLIHVTVSMSLIKTLTKLLIVTHIWPHFSRYIIHNVKMTDSLY